MDEYDSDSSLLSDDSVEITSTVGGEQKTERKAAKKEKKIQQSIFASFFNAAERGDKARARSIRTLPPPKKKTKTNSVLDHSKPPPVGKKTSQAKTYNDKKKTQQRICRVMMLQSNERKLNP